MTANAPVAPAIKKIFIDYQASPINILTGRSWKLRIKAEQLPEAVRLDGQAEASSATPNNLWSLWQSGRTVDFYDVDGAGPYRVKLANLTKKRSALGVGLTYPPDFILELEIAEVVE
jgi:hypothetical protein